MLSTANPNMYAPINELLNLPLVLGKVCHSRRDLNVTYAMMTDCFSHFQTGKMAATPKKEMKISGTHQYFKKG